MKNYGDLIFFLIIVFIGAFSVITKIVTSLLQKQQQNVLQRPQPKPGQITLTQKPIPRPVQINPTAKQKTITAPTPAQPQKQQMMAGKKALIEEQEENTQTQLTPFEENIIAANEIQTTEIGSKSYSFAEKIKVDRRFAIISHEILGKPKAFQD